MHFFGLLAVAMACLRHALSTADELEVRAAHSKVEGRLYWEGQNLIHLHHFDSTLPPWKTGHKVAQRNLVLVYSSSST